MIQRNRKQRRRRRLQLFLDWMLRFMVISWLMLFGFACIKWHVIPNLSGSPVPTANISLSILSSAQKSSQSYVDITIPQLYKNIHFQNEYGGAWTQGWSVEYRDDEWDQQILRVFVVPHSHNDPGWLRTAEEYYQERTRHILTNVIRSLKKDHRRKFIWEEVYYLKRWWKDASQTEKDSVVSLTKNGQLEIVGGGWVMNDEANTHYYAIIEQMTAGNIWIMENIGVAPTNAWSIDPFGHSTTMPVLLQQMGIKNMVIQRTHYEIKKYLALEKSLEFIWRQYYDTRNSTGILCHMMPFYFYDIPHTCGPEPGICCQFDFWRIPGYSNVLPCPWGKSPEAITLENIEEKARLLLDQYRKKSTLYRTNTLLVPLGDDFRYASEAELETQFTNYQKLFDFINSDSNMKAELKFGTLEDYFRTLRQNDNVEFPTLAGDFFTYADKDDDYWSGYFSSRPFYKALDRSLEETLRAANILYFFTHSKCTLPKFMLLERFAQNLALATENLALFQHHDAITGTAKNHVVADYAQRMQASLIDLHASMVASVEILLSKDNHGNKKTLEEQNYDSLSLLSEKTIVNLTDNHIRRLTIFNPLTTTVHYVITILVESPLLCVFDRHMQSITSQVTPEWAYESVITGMHRAQWIAHLPPLGFETYFVAKSTSYGQCEKAVLAALTFPNHAFACPELYRCTEFSNSDNIQISSTIQTLGFSRTGLLQWIKDVNNETITQVKEDLLYYSSSQSGPYIFSPSHEAESLLKPGALVIMAKGPVMEEIHVVQLSRIAGTSISKSTRVFKIADFVEMDYNIDLTGSEFNNKEIIARFQTGIENNRAFYTDSNGFQMILRQTYDKIPLQGNYYPMPSLAFLQEKGKRFSVHSRQALGAASLGNGWLEVMLDRRLSKDDGRGLEQGITDNRPVNIVLHLLLENSIADIQSTSTSATEMQSLLSHAVGSMLNYRPFLFLENAIPSKSTGLLKSLHFLQKEFPCDIQLVNLKLLTVMPAQYRLDSGLTLYRSGWDRSYKRNGCKVFEEGDFNLFGIFQAVKIQDIAQSSINFVHVEERNFGYMEKVSRKEGAGDAQRNGFLDIKPMELQAFKFSVVRNKSPSFIYSQ